jgi:nitrous oxide reductase accessory protein NosL
MKIIFIAAMTLLFACQENKDNTGYAENNISVSSITYEMGCENCGMNLKKFISTNHAVKMNNNDAHFYCSINCSTIGLEGLKGKAEAVYAVDYNSTKFINAEKAHYVIGSTLRGTMTNVSKFTFESLDDAEEFSKTFKGKEIVGYDRAVEMTKIEINERKN